MNGLTMAKGEESGEVYIPEFIGAIRSTQIVGDAKCDMGDGLTVDGNAADSGKETTREFDDKGRPIKESQVNGGYTRYEYPNNGVQSIVYSTITDINNNGADSADEVMSESWSDGAGRTRKSRTELPNSYGGYSGSLTEYPPKNADSQPKIALISST